MTAPDLDALIAELRRNAAAHFSYAENTLYTTAADALDRLRAEGTCTRREHMHEPYDTITRLQAEVDRLQLVREEWRRLYNAAEVRANDNAAKVNETRKRAERAEAQVQAVRALAEEWEHLADGPDETWPDEAHRLGVSVWHGPVFAEMLRAALDQIREDA